MAPALRPAPTSEPKPPSEPAAPSQAQPERPAFALPARFTALGTEPFWSARVVGERLTYSTPEDQSGTAIAVTRTATPAAIEIGGTLAGERLSLTITAGPCSDGMSDTVYPFSVRRRLGEDEQRGCARPD